MKLTHHFTQPLVDKWDKPGKFCVGGGLYLCVHPNAGGGVRKTWFFRYMDRVTKKSQDYGMGSVDLKGLQQAKNEALKLRADVLRGENPVNDKQARLEKERRAKASEVTFGYCVETFIAMRSAEWRNAKHRQQWENTLLDYCGNWYDLPIASIDKKMVLRALEGRWMTNTDTASKVRQRIARVFDWASGKGYFEGPNPARWTANLESDLPTPTKIMKVKPREALPHQQMQGFMQALKEKDTLTAKALLLQILTAVRPGEAVGAEWDEFDFASRLWTIPADRMKSIRDHRVPLSPPVMSMLKELHKDKQSSLVFPGARTGRPVCTDSVLKLVKKMRPGITSHGFRSTFRDWGAEKTNEPREVMEAALAHVVKDKTEAAYFRTDLFARRVKLMEKWASYCFSTAQKKKAASKKS